MTDTLRAALYSIPAQDRDTWVRMGMAIKSEIGDAGFHLWDTWSRQAPSYKPADAKAVWRSISPNGGVTIGTLYHEAKANGWLGEAPVRPEPSPEEKLRHQIEAEREEQRRRERAIEAAQRAELLIANAAHGEHPYLERKGFPQELGLIQQGNHYLGDNLVIADGDLLIPMRSMSDYRVQSVQSINADGGKKFYPGGSASATVFRIGPPRARTAWYCEGYATALSVRAALKHLYRNDQVACVFMASNLPKVTNVPGYVVADYDKHGVGEKYAKKTGLFWWMPPEVGDANDFHQRYGVEALAEELRKMLL